MKLVCRTHFSKFKKITSRCLYEKMEIQRNRIFVWSIFNLDIKMFKHNSGFNLNQLKVYRAIFRMTHD